MSHDDEEDEVGPFVCAECIGDEVLSDEIETEADTLRRELAELLADARQGAKTLGRH